MLMKTALFGNRYQASKSIYLERILKTLQDHSVHFCVENEFAAFITSELGIPLSDMDCFKSNDFDADIAISVGGDGTFLSTVAKLHGRDIPVLGVNTGRLGFLADVDPAHFAEALQALQEGRYRTETHSLIQTQTTTEGLQIPPFALNEIALLKHDNSSTIDIFVEVNGETLTRYVADGLVVSTPTGSTGYNLSSGGPIIHPGADVFCLTPVAPHSLSIRPIVLPDSVTITLRVKSRMGRYLLAIDGRSKSLPDNVTISLQRAQWNVRVLKIFHTEYFNTLREKLGWDGALIK